MNRARRSRLACLALVLLLPMVLMGCSNCGECLDTFANICALDPVGVCAVYALLYCGALFPGCPWTLTCPEACVGSAQECAAFSEQMQTTLIQFCEEYPDECQEYLDVLVESFDTDMLISQP